jgi:hypothetical protein
VKTLVPITTITVSISVYQGLEIRKKYLSAAQLSPPDGPKNGIEKWKVKISIIKDDFIDKYLNQERTFFKKGISNARKILLKKINDKEVEKLPNENDIICNHGVTKVENRSKNIKLLVIGDSLVCGVGCDGANKSPVLPHAIAKVLSFALKADVEWRSLGVVGGTIIELRQQLLKDIKESMLQTENYKSNTSQETEVENIVI